MLGSVAKVVWGSGNRNGGGPWDLTTVVYDSKSKDVSLETVSPYGLHFSDDGTTMYVGGLVTPVGIFQYTLSTAWDVSTASYAGSPGNFLDTDPEIIQQMGITLSSDGTKCYAIDWITDTTYQYTLSTAWDLGSGSYASKSKSSATEDSNSVGVEFGDSGTKMYITGQANLTIYQYTVGTAWDVSTASYGGSPGNSLDVSTETASAFEVRFKPDGKTMFLVDNDSGAHSILQYSLSTAWDISTATYTNKLKDVTSETGSISSVFFKPDGTKMYVASTANDTIYQYSII
jgi:hypothetical protein